MRNPMHQGHLYGDVPALILVAVVLGGLMLQSRGRSAAIA
jgi:hypothetical protein